MNFAPLFSAIRREELAALRHLEWQSEPLPGEAVTAVFSDETGFISLAGAIPFIEVRKREIPAAAGKVHLKSENLAQFLVQNRALLRSYRAAARAADYTAVGDLSQAHITQVTSDIPGMEAANFALYLAAQIAAAAGKTTLLIDADPQNQFVFPLLTLPEAPRVLTEHLQKPSSFKADMTKCIVPLQKNLSYLNLQASSLRPFDDAELSRICGILDADFENLVFYSGRMRSTWLSTNAHTNYAVCTSSYQGELQAITRHAPGCHTVLIKKGGEPYLPRLSAPFGQKLQLEDWLKNPPERAALREFILRTYRATRLVAGGRENLPDQLHCHTGFDLYARYASLEGADAERALNTLQKKLRAFYPKAAFFSARSVMNRVKNLPPRAATTILETGDEPQLVSLMDSPELRAAAIFPAGILPAISANGLRVSACSAHGFTRLREITARGGFTALLTAPRYRLSKPNALAAIMEQVQA